MHDAITAVRTAFEKTSEGSIEQPTRIVAGSGAAVAMLALDKKSKDSVVKALTLRPENPSAGRPAIHAVVMFFSGATGEPEALIDGTSLTALRTGAAAGVATDILAVSDASRLAVIGAGGQSADQVRAVCAVRPIKEVRVAARTAENAERVVNRLRSELPNVNLLAAASNAEAIRSADVVCTVTDATSPLFSSNDLDPNAHVNAMGAFTPAMCELPPELLSSAWVVAIDEIAAAKEEAGDLLQAISAEQLTWDAVVEIGKIRKRGRPDGRSVFKSVGIAAQDLLVAQLAVTRARQADTGRGARAAVEP